ncbi:MAG: YfhO family protein [Flavobacterium sp.]|nr:YfhO family protein [Pedobacter sp.]
MNNWLKRNGIHLAITGIFIALSFIYFSPVLKGLALPQYDVLQAQAMQKEIMKVKAETGTAPLWTNAMFGGMPAYQIWAQYPGNITTYIISFFKTVFPNPVDTVLLYLLGAYLLFSVLRIKPWLAAAGAIAFAFSSYNFIIIEAGHSNKAMAIAFFAPILAGIILTFRGKYLMGAVLTALFLAIEIRANHIQMTYYLFIALLIFIGIELFHAIRSKTLTEFGKAFGYLSVAAILAMAVNAGNLWTTYEYGQESIRGKSNLTTDAAQPNNGLDRDYAYQWSQGIGESFTFLVPNAYGGASTPQLDENSEVAKTLSARGVPTAQAVGFAKQLPTYWGEKSITSGPWYFGAIICFLFILGLFIVNNRIKWWILSATLLSMFLSFGKHLPFISDLFFNYFPLYNKFRAVESTLVIAGFLVPVLAILAVKEVTSHIKSPAKIQKKFLYSLYISVGILLVLILIPNVLFDFKPANHEEFLKQMMQVTEGDRSFADAIGNALIQDRISLARTDAIRSLLFILVGAGLIWALIKQKIKAEFASILLALAILVDMWGVDRRYLNNEKFVEKSVMEQQFQAREVDQIILRDPDPNYRVLDLTIPTFSSANATFFHKTIGGYHAAKLKRFQEVLDKQFNNSINEDVLDMLNTKYTISADQNGQSQRMQARSTAAGNAWFVPQVTFVKDADQEMEAISSFDPKKEAFVNNVFKPLIEEKKLGPINNASIKLINYKPDFLVYEYSAPTDAIAVFSEIWYDKGWNMYVDGEKKPYFRADYILRAAQLPGGNHKVEFKFEPKSYYTGEIISMIASILLVLSLAFAIYMEWKNSKKLKIA